MDRRAIPEGMTFGSWHAPDGWSLRRFDWPAIAAPAGSILFLGGRGDFVEKYLEALSHWHDAGWALSGFDWRGQGGSGRYTADPLTSHIPDFDPLVGDVEMFVREWRAAAPPPHVIVAHSMGAHLTLRALVRRSVSVDGAVLMSPMIDIRPLPARAAHFLAIAARICGQSERRIWRRDLGNYGDRMTSCALRQEDKMWWKAARPEIASGSPSWGWLQAACASIAALSESDLAGIETPVLMISSRRDPVVDVAAMRRAAGKLCKAELHLLDGKGHELLREADAVRFVVLGMIDAFLAPMLAHQTQGIRPA
jgi:lysophospholipase